LLDPFVFCSFYLLKTQGGLKKFILKHPKQFNLNDETVTLVKISEIPNEQDRCEENLTKIKNPEIIKNIGIDEISAFIQNIVLTHGTVKTTNTICYALCDLLNMQEFVENSG